MVIDRLRDVFEVRDHPLTLVSQKQETREDFVVETLVFATRDGERVRGFVARPAEPGPHPALLYIHAHGARYAIGADELLDGRRALLSPLGPEFARRGYVTLMIEMPAFCTRAEPSESARAKALLWEGRSLAGQMLGEQAAALAWLAARGDVDPARIGVYGISMGATLGYWLAAVDARISCAAHLCCYADYRALIAAGAHDLHGIYLTIPGLLPIAGNGEIAGLIAPRPQFIAIGDQDPLTPPEAVDIALAETRAAYARAGAADRLLVHREPETGHVETAPMRDAVLAFFSDNL